MKVILLEKLANLGDIGSVVTVKSGYARNYLLPQGLAKSATAENIKIIEEEKDKLLAASTDKLNQAKALAKQLSELKVQFEVAASDEGKLFGSVGVREISQYLTEQGLKIEKKQIALTDGSFRQTGSFNAKVMLHPDVAQQIEIHITAKA